MKKYIRDSSKKFFYTIIVLVGIFIIWNYTPPYVLPRAKISNIFAFFFQQGRSLKMIFEKKQISDFSWQAQYEALFDQFTRLQAENVLYHNALFENNELKKLLDYKESTKIPLLIAKIIGKPPEEFSRTWILDKGERDGVKIGQAVIGNGNYIVGKIQSVAPDHSIVLLVQDNHFEIAASLLSSLKTTGISAGSFGLGITLQYIPRTENISLGETIITSGIEPEIPRGLIIGEIKEITTRANDLFQSAVISQPNEFQFLTFVGILRGSL